MRNFINAIAINNVNVNLAGSVNVAGIIDMRSGDPMLHSDSSLYASQWHKQEDRLTRSKNLHKHLYVTAAPEAFAAPATGITPAATGPQKSLLPTRGLAGTGRVERGQRVQERARLSHLHAEPACQKQPGECPQRTVSFRTATRG